MNKVEVKFGEWIEQGLNLYKANFGMLALASLISTLVSGVTIGICSGPMAAGLTMICLALRDGAQPKPAAGDVTKGFQLFVPSFLVVLLVGVIAFVFCLVAMLTCVGSLLYPLIAAVLGAATFFTFFLVVDQKLGAIDALKANIAILKTNFWMFVAFSLVAGLIGGLGTILCGVGVILTLPATTCIAAVAYRDVQAQMAKPAAQA